MCFRGCAVEGGLRIFLNTLRVYPKKHSCCCEEGVRSSDTPLRRTARVVQGSSLIICSEQACLAVWFDV